MLPLYVTLDSLAAAILVHEWRSTGKIGKYSMIGAGFIFVQSLVHVPIVHSDWFLEAVRYVAGLIHYRLRFDLAGRRACRIAVVATSRERHPCPRWLDVSCGAAL